MFYLTVSAEQQWRHLFGYGGLGQAAAYPTVTVVLSEPFVYSNFVSSFIVIIL